ncbi:MAG: MFS transporter [Clostridia bacterium]
MNDQKQKLNTKMTILTGFGFMATSIAWAIYDPYITKILEKLLSSSAFITELSAKLNDALPWLAKLASAQGEDVGFGASITLVPLFIGVIMTFDNIFGVIFQPTFGKLSDRCHSKYGKRRPFIIIGAPISAALFLLIPIVALNTGNIAATMVCIILFVFVMSLWRAPVVALMPDLTPPELRSEGNAIINLMGGIGSFIGMIAGTIAILIYTVFAGTPADEYATYPVVFAIGSIVMIAGAVVLMFFVQEEDSRIDIKAEKNMAQDAKAEKEVAKAARKAEKEAAKAVKLTTPERVSLIFMLLALFFLFCASNAIQTFFSLFAAEILHMTTAQATIVLAIFAICAAIAAIPAGKLGTKFGRKKTIVGGLALFMAAFVVFFSVYIGVLSSNDISSSTYISANTVYANIESAIDEVNSSLTTEDGEEALTLTIDGYVSYLEDGEETAYEAVTQYLVDSTEGAFSLDSLITTSNDVLGQEVADGDYSAALLNITSTIDSVTKILKVLIYPVLIIGGFANMFITVNTLPLVLEIGGVGKVGTFTGYYYTATFSAQIASPIVYGFVAMISGTYMSLFYYSPVAFALCFLCILFVKHGEAVPQEIIDKIQEENED